MDLSTLSTITQIIAIAVLVFVIYSVNHRKPHRSSKK